MIYFANGDTVRTWTVSPSRDPINYKIKPYTCYSCMIRKTRAACISVLDANDAAISCHKFFFLVLKRYRNRSRDASGLRSGFGDKSLGIRQIHPFLVFFHTALLIGEDRFRGKVPRRVVAHHYHHHHHHHHHPARITNHRHHRHRGTVEVPLGKILHTERKWSVVRNYQIRQFFWSLLLMA